MTHVKEIKNSRNGTNFVNSKPDPDQHDHSGDPTISPEMGKTSEIGYVTLLDPMVSPSPLPHEPGRVPYTTSNAISPGPGEATINKNATIAQRLPTNGSLSCENLMVKTMSLKRKRMRVVSYSEMKTTSFQNTSSYLLIKQQWPSVVDQELLDAKSQIENVESVQDDDDVLTPLYRDISKFKRSYELMEQTLKVYVYEEGERPIFHEFDLRGIYASEGWFMKQLTTKTKFVTKDPNIAHLFYLPFGSHNLEHTLYVPESHKHTNLIEYLNSYINLIKGRYPFWNRTCGGDHFLVACHDWAPEETRHHMANCIKSLCNADLREGFLFGKDTSLPETYMHSNLDPMRNIGGKAPSERSILAFFAGQMHGHVRPTLLKFWEDKDPSMKIVSHMKKSQYMKHMKNSRYCICARGYEVNSPRVVEAISYDCVPVIISDNFVVPFLETLNWESFAVFVLEKDIPNLKNILESIPEKRYMEMHENVKRVQRHFIWHLNPEKYDIFHMILHSIWYTRVFRSTH
ncbi:unnamed protein product [Cuscuta epithymum]|uniref:Exostosin GT47 domain-containing protein n=1 Tax=Cuscuta epithymum TaxID=186058 RepID=A0AAV0C479_9ASTE|nr:unnamed protein product [Cuscuta epithymum]